MRKGSESSLILIPVYVAIDTIWAIFVLLFLGHFAYDGSSMQCRLGESRNETICKNGTSFCVKMFLFMLSCYLDVCITYCNVTRCFCALLSSFDAVRKLDEYFSRRFLVQ